VQILPLAVLATSEGKTGSGRGPRPYSLTNSYALANVYAEAFKFKDINLPSQEHFAITRVAEVSLCRLNVKE
jgi:hypothetical protein